MLIRLVVILLLISGVAMAVNTPPGSPRAQRKLYFTTELQKAAFLGELKTLKQLLAFAERFSSAREHILAETPEGLNALHMAAIQDNIPAMRILLRSPFYKRFLLRPELNLKPDVNLVVRKKGWPSLEACRTILVNVPEFAPQLFALYPKDKELRDLFPIELSIFKGTARLNEQFNPDTLKKMLENVREYERGRFEGIIEAAQLILQQPVPNHELVEKLIKRLTKFLAAKTIAVE